MKRVWLCLGLVWAGLAFAQTPEQTEKARVAFGAAQKLYQASRFAEALKKFEEAQALKPHPVIVFNIARCHELMGNSAQALKAYREYLRLSPDATDKAAVQASIAKLEKKVPAVVTQTLIVNAEPPGATIAVDGKKVAAATVTIDVSAGEHTLEVSAAGYETLKRQVTVASGRTVELNLSLKPTPAPPPPPAPMVSADVPRKEKEPELTPTTAPAEPMVTKPVDQPKHVRTFTWVAGGTAIAAGAVATGLGVGASFSANSLKSGDGTRSSMEAGQLASSAQGMATGANIAWGVAGAAAITAVVLFFVEGN